MVFLANHTYDVFDFVAKAQETGDKTISGFLKAVLQLKSSTKMQNFGVNNQYQWGFSRAISVRPHYDRESYTPASFSVPPVVSSALPLLPVRQSAFAWMAGVRQPSDPNEARK